MADVDDTCRRMALRDAQEHSAPLLRVRRGAQRSWEDAFTYHNPCAVSPDPTPSAERRSHGCKHWSERRRPGPSNSTSLNETPEEEEAEPNWQEAELSPPRYRKDLAKLGVPTNNVDSVSASSRHFSSGLAFDGIDETIHCASELQHSIDQVPNIHSLQHTPALPRSPLHQTHALSSPRSSVCEAEALPTRQSTATHLSYRWATPSRDKSSDRDSYLNSLYRDTRSSGHCSLTAASFAFSTFPRRSPRTRTEQRGSKISTPMRIRSSQDLFASAATALSELHRAGSSHLLRPAVNRLPSKSTPNLITRVVSSHVIHSRHSSANVSPNPSGHYLFRSTSGPSPYMACSASGEPPILEILNGCVSPLQRLEQDVSSEYSSAPSITSFYTAKTENKSQLRFPSFDSPEKQAIPRSTAARATPMPEMSSGSSIMEHSEVLLERLVDASPSPGRIRSVALPPPQYLHGASNDEDPRRPVSNGSNVSNISSSSQKQAYEDAMPFLHNPHHHNAHPQPSHNQHPTLLSGSWRNDSGVDISSVASRPKLHNQPVQTPIPSPSLDRLDVMDTSATSPEHRMSKRSSSKANRAFAIFSPAPGLEDFPDLNRYPNPSMVLNRRSMPVPATSDLMHSVTSYTIRRPERPYSHGARPRAHYQQAHYGAPIHNGASEASRHAFSDRLPPPPPPQPALRLNSRQLPARRRDQENSGSAEEEMMREEFRGLEIRLRGGGSENRQDDTPPHEGRFERLMGGY